MKNFFVMVWAMALSVSLVYGGQTEEYSCKSSVRTASPRIVGGEKVTDVNDYPWMVALGDVQKDEQGEFFNQSCGGSLIGAKWVLTASHCIMSDCGGIIDTENFYVLIGTLDVEDLENGKRIKVKRIIGHPDYDPETTSSDIALLELEESVTDYAPVQLYRGSDTLAGKECTVIGWGNTVGYGHPDEEEETWMLRQVSISVISNEQCQNEYNTNAYGEEINDTMLCAGIEEGGKDSCQGDSGGPLAIQEDGVWKQAGVVSWGGGSECAEKGLYGVYARVSEFISFIDECTTGVSVWGKITTSAAGHEELGVKNAAISVNGTAYEAVTDERGEFSIMIPKGGISAGNHTVSVTASGLADSSQSVTIQDQEGESVEVSKKLSLSQSGIQGDFSGNSKLGIEDCIGILQRLTQK